MMRDITHLAEYYKQYDEDGRLSAANHGKVEYITTMHYIHKYLERGMRVLEIGAGTGRYSLALSREGYQVNALELIEHNLDVMRSRMEPEDTLTAEQGDALNLSRFPDETFDVTLLLGPMYHLYTIEEQVQALKEAVRVTKKQGTVMVAYCMNEATILQYCFGKKGIWDCRQRNLLTEDFHCMSHPEDLFQMERVEDIEYLNTFLPVRRMGLIATDGAACYMDEVLDQMDEEMFKEFISYHLATCERQDLIGASNHTLDILQRIN